MIYRGITYRSIGDPAIGSSGETNKSRDLMAFDIVSCIYTAAAARPPPQLHPIKLEKMSNDESYPI